jgi:hypothetical protein
MILAATARPPAPKIAITRIFLLVDICRLRKMRVMAILGAGGLAVAASIIRLVLIVFTGQSKDADSESMAMAR